jgi:hypothetical protein
LAACVLIALFVCCFSAFEDKIQAALRLEHRGVTVGNL